MSGSIAFHHAFAVNYNRIARELVTPIKVGAPSLTEEFDVSKKIITFEKGIWDTGATGTVITPKVVAALELSPTGMQRVHCVNIEKDVPTYVVDLILPNNVLIKNLNVTVGEIVGTDILIGMDIIQAGDFLISNAGGKTNFSFCTPPHSNSFCLLQKSEKVNERHHKKRRL